MSARAPQAIRDLFDLIHAKIPQAVLSGIVGDVAHSFGYHLAPRDLPAGDYSYQLAADRAGPTDAASALDVSLPPDLMRTVTGRLVAAAKANDSRLRALREFCGTLDGHNTYPWQLTPTNASEGVGSWDDSHLWHVHLSFLREYADNAAALAPIADVMAGVALNTKEDDLPLTEQDVTKIWAHVIDTNTGTAASSLRDARQIARRAEIAANAATASVTAVSKVAADALARVADVQTKLTALPAAVAKELPAGSVDAKVVEDAVRRALNATTFKAAA